MSSGEKTLLTTETQRYSGKSLKPPSSLGKNN